jgi:hypothetical protein
MPVPGLARPRIWMIGEKKESWKGKKVSIVLHAATSTCLRAARPLTGRTMLRPRRQRSAPAFCIKCGSIAREPGHPVSCRSPGTLSALSLHEIPVRPFTISCLAFSAFSPLLRVGSIFSTRVNILSSRQWPNENCGSCVLMEEGYAVYHPSTFSSRSWRWSPQKIRPSPATSLI